MLKIKCIPKKALVLALSSCFIFSNTSLAMDAFGCHIPLDSDYHLTRDILNIGGGRDRPRPLNINVQQMTVSFNNQAVPASRHHIIPFNTLRNFFNAVIQSNDPYALRTFSSVLNRLVSDALENQSYNHQALTLFHLENARNLVTQMARGTFNGQTISPAHYAEPLGVLITLFSWMPGNIFIGPSLRADDPRNDFERNSRSIIGREQFDDLYRLFTAMNSYIEGTHNTNDDLVSIVARLGSIRNELYTYLETRWRQDNNGRYYIFNNINNRGPRNTDSVLEKPPIEQEDKYCLIATEIAREQLLSVLFF